MNNLVKVFMDFNGTYTVFEILNYQDLSNDLIKELEKFSASKNGFFRHDIKTFNIMRKWDEEQVKEILKKYNINIYFSNHDEQQEPLYRMRVLFGRYSGKRWEDVPTSYLNWIMDNIEEQTKYWNLAYAEFKRRANMVEYDLLETIPFGKYKGNKWIDIPKDYLLWLVEQPQLDKEDYKSFKDTAILALKYIEYEEALEDEETNQKTKRKIRP